MAEQILLVDVPQSVDTHRAPDWFRNSIVKRREYWHRVYEMIRDKWACYEYYGSFP